MAGRHAAHRCPEEPHELHAVTADVDDAPVPEEERDRITEALKFACLATYRYFRNAPAERLPLLGGAAVYGGGLLAHGYDMPWWAIAGPTVPAAIITYAAGVNRLSMPSAIGLTLAALTCGSWLATVAETGANRVLNWIYVGAFAFGYSIYRWAHHRAKKRRGRGVDDTAAEQQPETVPGATPRIAWEKYFAGWGMDGAAVITAEPTRLGERVLLNTKSTGKRASQFTGRALEERIAEDFDVATARIRVSIAGLPAGQLSISVQLIDPWATPIPHPALDPDAEITLPEVADATEPLVIGMDPETGEPLTVTVWAEDGAKHTYILAINGGGKSVTLNCILERLTAAFNCVVWGINLSKAQEMRRWRPALDLSACGPDDRKKARLMLKMARKLIVYRGAQPRDTANLIPSARRKLLVLAIDEIDEFTKTPDGSIDMGVVEDLGKCASKGRSEAVALIVAGQRNTQSHGGSTDVVTQMTNYVVLKGVSSNDLMRMGIPVPDMGEYGGGNPGVLATMLKSETVAHTGRSFALAAGKDTETGLGQIDRVIVDRPPNSLEGDEIAHLGEAYISLKSGQMPSTAATSTLERESDPADQPPTTGGGVEVTSSDERSQTIDEIRERHLFVVPPLTPEGQERLLQMRQAQQEQADRDELAAASPLDAETRTKLITLASTADGVSRKEIAEALGVSPTTAWRYMRQLASEEVVESRGHGPAARYIARGEHIA
ncbi:winged helix-turn-helix domain-containing protein [Nonomuraea rhizosphaerae]|uniref:winged helix-turn-helix domain-containing protein n=1 Tax=Nonomuraea rhizosphaerae TaxID=2665663 RepID=UPI001C60232D|nr:winged helix-turn-helix domain-containing protein [Nonomuraea rhizosphaerae]